MRKLFYYLAVQLALTACGNNNPAEDSHKATDHSSHSTGHSVTTPGLTTDQGKKWKADEATIQGIRQMAATAAAGRAGTLKNQTLTDSLKANFAEIFKKCTMKGAAHDQLHLYLQPLKLELDALANGADEVQSLHTIQDHLAKFDQYFE